MNLEEAFEEFDLYNASDPSLEDFNGNLIPKSVLYGLRMSQCLDAYEPKAAIEVKLAARSQHIGRWEIARSKYPMDKKGYHTWRTTLAEHHANIAGKILKELSFEPELIEKVKFLLQKKDLKNNVNTQILEDTIFLVFVRFYLEEFAAKHEDDKVIEIIAKTLKKVSQRAIAKSSEIKVSPRMEKLIGKAIKLI